MSSLDFESSSAAAPEFFSPTTIILFIKSSDACSLRDKLDAPNTILEYLCGSLNKDGKLPLSFLPKTFITVIGEESYDSDEKLMGLRDQFGKRHGFQFFFKTNKPQYLKRGRDIFSEIYLHTVSIGPKYSDDYSDYLGEGSFYNDGHKLLEWNGTNFKPDDIIANLGDYPQIEFLLDNFWLKKTYRGIADGHDLKKFYLETHPMVTTIADSFASFNYYDRFMGAMYSKHPVKKEFLLMKKIEAVDKIPVEEAFEKFFHDEIVQAGESSGSNLYMAFQRFCLMNHSKLTCQTKFSQFMQAKGFEPDKHGIMIYKVSLKYIQPFESKIIEETLKKITDPFVLFLNERAKEGSTMSSVLRKAYEKFALEKGFAVPTSGTFPGILKSHGLVMTKKGSGNFYNLGLK